MPPPYPAADWIDAFGVAFREARNRSRMSQMKLGHEAARAWREPSHRNTVSNIERGLTNPSLTLIVELVNEMGGDVAAIFQRADELLATATNTGSIYEAPSPRRGPLHFKPEDAAP